MMSGLCRTEESLQLCATFEKSHPEAEVSAVPKLVPRHGIGVSAHRCAYGFSGGRDNEVHTDMNSAETGVFSRFGIFLAWMLGAESAR